MKELLDVSEINKNLDGQTKIHDDSSSKDSQSNKEETEEDKLKAFKKLGKVTKDNDGKLIMRDEDEKVEVNFDTFKNLMIHYGGLKAIIAYQILCCIERFIGERNTYNIGIWTSEAELQHS